jgi:hypothetical protein
MNEKRKRFVDRCWWSWKIIAYKNLHIPSKLLTIEISKFIWIQFGSLLRMDLKRCNFRMCDYREKTIWSTNDFDDSRFSNKLRPNIRRY